MTLPAGSVTLWVAGNRQHDELVEVAASYGMPDDALLFNAPPDDPFGGLDLDDPETLAGLSERVRAVCPAFVVIDTVGMTTGRNLCRPEEARAYLGPLADLATSTGVPVLALTHLSKDKEALGRRIIGAARVVWNMTQPNPEGQPDRRRLWVSKSYAVKPPALGVTMGEGGNNYDFEPPSEPEPAPRRRGPAPAKLEACMAWLAERLATPSRVTDIRKDAEATDFSSGTLYAAREALGADEYVLDGRKWWKLPAADADLDPSRLSEMSPPTGPADIPDNADSPAGLTAARSPSPPASPLRLSEMSIPPGNLETPTTDTSPGSMASRREGRP